MGEPRWGIMSTFPLPMPVMHDAHVFPRFFANNRSLGLAYLPLDEQIHERGNRSFLLKGSLCFVIVSTLNDTSNCILLYNQSAAWLKDASWGEHQVMVANATVISGWWPSRRGEGAPPQQPRMAPFCKGTLTDDLMLPWTGCQARISAWPMCHICAI